MFKQNGKQNGKSRFTVLLSSEIAEQARSAAAYLAGHPAYLTLGQLVENALATELARLRGEHNHGKPFAAAGPVKTGRPVGRRGPARKES